MCVEVPESTTNSLSSGRTGDRAGRDTKPPKSKKNVAPILIQVSLDFAHIFCQVPLCEPIALLLTYPHGCDPRIWEQRNCAHESERVGSHPAMVLFFPRSFSERSASGVYRRPRLDLEEFRPFRNIEFIVGGTIYGETQPNFLLFLIDATEPVPPLLIVLSFGCRSASLHRKEYLSPNMQPACVL